MIPGTKQAKQVKQVAQMARNPGESDKMQAITHIIATLEHRQIERVEELHDALGIDGIERTKDQDDREEQLLGVVEALANGELEQYWLDEVAGDHVENPGDVEPYLGMDDNDWTDQIESWAETYRERAPDATEGYSDHELAQSHVQSTFGVDLAEFELEIVGWSVGKALETMLASNLQAVESGIEAATAAVTEDSE